jgi:sugar phosphate isomerase/epimerase
MKKLLALLCIVLNASFLSGCNSTTDNTAAQQALVVPPVSVQLWSVRDKLEKDFKGTLKQLASLGFKGVEFAGNYGPYSEDPEGLKAYLNSIGLKTSGAHLNVKKLKSANSNKLLGFIQALDAKYVLISSDHRAWSATGIDSLIEDLKMLTPKVAKYGLQLGYHNHDQEFDDYKNTTFWDHIAKNTPQSFVLQMDAGWVNYAGKDPVDYLKRYPNRTLTTHIKVRTHKGSNQSPILGKDGYDWVNHIKHNISVGGTKWLVVEQEEYPEGLDSMQSVAQSKKGLDEIISQL